MSKHLSAKQITGLEKIGNVYAPGTGELGSFSALRCSAEVDRILDYMQASDLADLKLLLTLMSFLPMFVIRAFLALIEKSPRLPDWLGAPLRFVRIGIRGLVLTLYYSHPKAHQALGYHVDVYTEDLLECVPAQK
jgi:hypothetical protein